MVIRRINPRAFILAIEFFFLNRAFLYDFISNNELLSSVYVSISEVIVVYELLCFVLRITNKSRLIIDESLGVIITITYFVYVIVDSLFVGGNIRRTIMVAYPIIGTLLFVDRNAQKNAYALAKGLSGFAVFSIILNLVDMVFVKHVFSEQVTSFLLGGKNGLGISISMLLSFILVNNKLEAPKTNDRIDRKEIVWVIICVISAAISRSSTTIASVIVLIAIWFIERKGKLFTWIINPKAYGAIYIGVWFALIVFRLHYIFASIITGFFGKDLTLSHRTIIWDRALQLISERPMFGYGTPDSYNVFSVKHDYSGGNNDAWSTLSAHNEFLQLAYIGGIVLIVLFVLFFLISTRKVNRANPIFPLYYLSVVVISIVWLTEVPGENAMFTMLFFCMYSGTIYNKYKLEVSGNENYPVYINYCACI